MLFNMIKSMEIKNLLHRQATELDSEIGNQKLIGFINNHQIKIFSMVDNKVVFYVQQQCKQVYQ